MFVVYDTEKQEVPIKIWLEGKNHLESDCLTQVINVSNHPAIFHHVSLMPDTHTGYAMPIGGVAALSNAISPYFVGVDIGCGMCAVKTSILADTIAKPQLREIIEGMKLRVPMGMGQSYSFPQTWNKFDEYISEHGDPGDFTGWYDEKIWDTAKKSLGTLGSGNHFIEVQTDGTNIWLMLHSGSRNLGFKIADYYHKLAVKLNHKWHSEIPNDDCAFLPTDSVAGINYIEDMTFALEYAQENRRRMMENFKHSVKDVSQNIEFTDEVNIHHNFAALEHHYGRNVWVHRKGATQAKKDQLGIIPGSMGTPSYIVKGLGNMESFMSCSHGAGRKMGRKEASRSLDRADCDAAMEGIVWDGYQKIRQRGKNKPKVLDLGEAPQAYKNIKTVIENQKDLVEVVVELKPLA